MQAGLLLAGIFALKLYVSLAGVPDYILPPPERVARSILDVTVSGELLRHGTATLTEIVLGFIAGSAGGILIGYCLAKMPAVEDLLSPYVLFAQTAPKIALVPLFVMWFGLGMTSKMVIITLMTFFPVMVNTILGVRSVDPNLKSLLKILGADPWQRFMFVEVYSSLPLIFAGLRLGMIQATIGAIVAEWVSGKVGLGYLLVFGSTTFKSDLLLAAIVLTSAVGVLTYHAIVILENRMLWWHESRSPSSSPSADRRAEPTGRCSA
jgi:NitT/TauT family transport system permease protein